MRHLIFLAFVVFVVSTHAEAKHAQAKNAKAKATNVQRKIASVSNSLDCKLEKRSPNAAPVIEKFSVTLAYACNSDAGCPNNVDRYEGTAPPSSLIPNYSLVFKLSSENRGSFIETTVLHLGRSIASKTVNYMDNTESYITQASVNLDFNSADGKQFNVTCGLPEER